MSFNWTNPYPTVRTPVFARNLVATSQPLAAQAGLRMLQSGGNAVDAAVAAAAVITMTEPCSNGLGADNFAIVWDPASQQLLGLNSSGIAPAAWSLDFFRRKYGEDLPKNRPMRGWDSVTTPGAVAGWTLLHGRLGKLSFADVMAPAIEYAERGFAVSPIVHDKWQRAAPLLKDGPGFAEHFLPKGRAPRIGEHFVLAGAAHTLKLLAQHGGAAFYQGEIAEGIERHARATGGALRASDLAAYWDFVQENGWVDTISTPFHGHELHEIPPNGQGIAALSCLGILRHMKLADYAVDSADWHHAAIEAMKLAFADTYEHVADPRAMRVSTDAMLDDGLPRAACESHRHAAGAGVLSRDTAARRHDLPVGRRRERHDGVTDPVELHGFRLGSGGAGLRHLAAEPRLWILDRCGESERHRPGQTAIPHDHPGLSDEGRAAGNELRRHGWQHATSGSCADTGAHAAGTAAAAGRL